jgi:hypothetical protein
MCKNILDESVKIILTLQVHIGVRKKTGQFFSESASGVAVHPPSYWRRAGSCNDSHFQKQSNQTKINVIKNLSCSEYESEDDILCEMELNL